MRPAAVETGDSTCLGGLPAAIMEGLSEPQKKTGDQRGCNRFSTMPSKKRPVRAKRASPSVGEALAKRGPSPASVTGQPTKSTALAELSPRGFPIVGIGASAGGLEALEELLSHMPANTGMGFVIVTHQHPGHTSLLPELLGKSTDLTVLPRRTDRRSSRIAST